MELPRRARWETEDELIFIDGLGTGACSDHPASRIQALRGYISGIHKRQDWGLVDRVEVIAHAMGRLHEEEEKATNGRVIHFPL